MDNQLFEENKKLAYYVVRKYFSHLNYSLGKFDKDDIEQHALIGLFRASQAFDESKNFKFSTFAITYIKYEIRDFLRDFNYNLKLPREVKITISKINREYDEMPSIEEIMDKYQVSKVNATMVKEYSNLKLVNLDVTFGEDNEMSVGDIVKSNIDVEDMVEKKMLLEDALSVLDEKERKVFIAKIKGRKERDLSKEVGCSQPHVNRLKQRAVKKIQEYIGV